MTQGATKNLKVAIYVRVSTQQQTTDNQLLDLYEICERNDWTVVEEYNETISGTKSASDRKELKRMLDDASRKKFDKLVVWSVDRVGRSMKHLVSVLSQLKDLEVDIYSYKQGNWNRDERQNAANHKQACQTFSVGIDIAVGHPFLGEQIVVQEHGREALNIA